MHRSRLDTARLSWPTERHGTPVTLSMATPAPQPDLVFRAIDLLSSAADVRVGPGRQRLTSACQDLEPAAGMVSFTGFLSEAPGRLPLLFTVAASLADLPHPEATEVEGAVTAVTLAPGPGIRILALSPVDEAGAIRPTFTANYLIQTDAGVLSLAFATPHVDSAPEFAAVFARLAESVELSA